MKKVWVFALVILLLCVGVWAEDSVNDLGKTSGLNEDLKGLNSSLDTNKIQNSTNGILVREVNFPEKWHVQIKFLLGLSGDKNIDLQTLIVLICFAGSLILVVKNLYGSLRPKEKGLESFIVGMTITIVGSITGGLMAFSKGILYFSSLFGVLKGWNLLTLILAIALIGLFLIFTSKMFRSIANRRRISDAEKIGESLGTSAIIAERTAEITSLGRK